MQLESRIGRVIIIWVLPQGCGGDLQYLPQEDSRKIPLSRLYFLRQNTFLTQCFAVFSLRSSLYSLGWRKAHTDVPPSVTHCEFKLLVCWESVKGRIFFFWTVSFVLLSIILMTCICFTSVLQGQPCPGKRLRSHYMERCMKLPVDLRKGRPITWEKGLCVA